MQVLKCVRKKLRPTWVQKEAQRIGKKLVEVSAPRSVYLFGSAAEDRMTDQSDFDFLIVHASEKSIREAQRKLRPFFPLSKYPVDLVWVTEATFKAKREIGGVCFVAFHEGIQVHGTEEIR